MRGHVISLLTDVLHALGLNLPLPLR